MPSSLQRQRIIKRLKQLAVPKAAPSLLANDTTNDGEPEIPKPELGQIRLFPTMAGSHTITVDQLIHAPHGSADSDPKHTLNLHSTQDFEVFGLRFSLPPNAVHQSYPPQGHADHNLVLPHIVFEDAHLPWEQVGSPSAEHPSALGAQKPRNSVPWLALLVFTEDELKLSTQELASIAGAGTPIAGGVTQSATTMSVKLPLGNVLHLNTPTGTVCCPVSDDDHHDPIDQTQVVDMVFPRGDLFTSFFCSYNSQGERIIPAHGMPDLSRYKYLAHVRNVNTQRIGDAGEDDMGLYSVIVSHRCGPNPGVKRQVVTPKVVPTMMETVNIDLPKSVIVHLVSLQGIEANLTLPKPRATRVGLVSLFSWTYTCIPPDSINFLDAMRAIGQQVAQPLRPLVTDIGTSPTATPNQVKNATRMRDRLIDGYSLVRYLPRTGEQTVAWTRGCLTPTLPPHPPTPFWPSQCNFSTSLQILDAHLGIMDISYSTAWELGRTLAIADRAFTASVVRVRRATNIFALREAKKEMLGSQFQGTQQIIGGLPDALRLMADIPKELANGKRVVDPTKRWMPSEITPTSLSSLTQATPESRNLFVHHAFKAAELISSATTLAGSAEEDDDLVPYNEVNIPSNTDWSLILKWIVDKLFLYNIPAHYLITDPSHLPTESIRFFYIDPTWMDSLIDGALSVGNHLERSNDVVRQAMKHRLNQYFNPAQLPRPQIPTYGFLLRSAVVQAFPNLQVHAPWPGADPRVDTRVEVLRLEALDKDVLLCLFDRLPGSHFDPLNGIIISQPPHQQRFAAATRLGPNPAAHDANELEFEFRKLYTSTSKEPGDLAWSPLSVRTWREGQGEIPVVHHALNPANPSVIFDWDNNTLVVEHFAMACTNVLTQEMTTTTQGVTTTFFNDPTPSSALVGHQLNDPINKVTIAAPADHTNQPRPSEIRFIHLPTGDLPLSLQPNPSVAALMSHPQEIKKASSSSKRPPAERQDQPSVPDSRSQHLPASPAITQPVQSVPSAAALPIGIIGAQFIQSAFVLGHPTDPVLPMHPDSSPLQLPVDLVFSFKTASASRRIPNLKLFRLNVRIPIGSGPTDLCTVYDGTGGKMLSNQRFNVHIAPSTTNKFLMVSLIPRSTTQLVPVDVNKDVSFILNQVTLNGVSGEVRMEVEEDYRERQVNDPTKWTLIGPGRSAIIVRKRLLTT